MTNPVRSALLAAAVALAPAMSGCGGGGGGSAPTTSAPSTTPTPQAEIEVPEQPPEIAASRNAASKDALAAIRNLVKKGAIDMWQRLRANDRSRIMRHTNHTLHSAAASGDLRAVKKLLAAGADPNARDEVPFPAGDVPGVADHLPGTTPLQEAVRWGGGLDVVEALITAGADPNARNEGGLTLLHSAMFRNSPAVVEALIAAGADPSARDEDNFARFRAAICRRSEVGDITMGPGGMYLGSGLAVLGWVHLSSSFAIVHSNGGIVVGPGAASFEGLTLIGPAFIDLDVHC